MTENYRIIIVDDISETRENISKLLQFEGDIEVVGSYASGKDALAAVCQLDPDVILMDINMPDMDGITATELIRKANPASQIVILSVQGDTTYMRRAMLAGARDYLTKPPVTDDLVEAIRKSGDVARTERAKAAEQATALLGMIAAGNAVAPKKAGKVVVVYSPKGGTGVTTLAINLSIALQSATNQVLVLDGNFQFGSVPLFINEPSKNTIVELTSRYGQLDAEFIKEVVPLHTKSGVRFLPAPQHLEEAEQITAEQYQTVLGALRDEFGTIVIDATHTINDILLTSLDMADSIIVVLTQDIPAIQNTRVLLDLLSSLKIPKEKITLVMNRYDKRISITSEKVGDSLKMPLEFSIPLDDKIVLTSVNRGLPFMLNPVNEPVVQQVQNLAMAISERLENK